MKKTFCFSHTLESSVEGQNKDVDRTTRSRRITSQESALHACLGRARVSHELFLTQRGSERRVVCSGQRVALLSLFLPRIPPGSELQLTPLSFRLNSPEEAPESKRRLGEGTPDERKKECEAANVDIHITVQNRLLLIQILSSFSHTRTHKFSELICSRGGLQSI